MGPMFKKGQILERHYPDQDNAVEVIEVLSAALTYDTEEDDFGEEYNVGDPYYTYTCKAIKDTRLVRTYSIDTGVITMKPAKLGGRWYNESQLTAYYRLVNPIKRNLPEWF